MPVNCRLTLLMIETLDDCVGRVVDKVNSLGLAERTLIVFTSDNGGLHVPEGPRTPATHNTPCRAGKGFCYEGGLRIPLIVCWPGHVAQGRVLIGRRSRQFDVAQDLQPGLDRGHAREPLLLWPALVLPQAHPVDQGFQGRALQEQRHGDDPKGQEDDDIAAGQRGAVGQDQRNGERGGSREAEKEDYAHVHVGFDWVRCRIFFQTFPVG